MLSPDLSAKVEARARFEAEARAISSLSHPHICALFDVGREDATDYLVMELLEGETLSARIARGPLPIQDVLKIAVQVMAYRRAEIPCRLERVFLDTGQRTLFKEFAPADRAGLLSLREVYVTDDLRSYAYTTYYQVSSLFVSERGE